tara:strand:+ start:912 stop:1439 length:528 start_codon:yes stop_codon:yes gene_type:complete
MPKKTFSSQDYNSPDGMLTSIWGPPMWHALHTISFNYPINPIKDDKTTYYNYFKSLQGVLPCKYCRDNLKDNYKKLSLNKSVFKNRDTLSRFVYNLHEMVNKRLGKISNLTYTQVRDRYENFRARCIDNKNSKLEKGCTNSLYGIKGKCVMDIVPKSSQRKTLNIHSSCKIKKKK